MPKIAILCPTMGRPDMCKMMIESVRKTAFNLKEIVFYLVLTEGDETKDKYVEMVLFYKSLNIPMGLYEFPDWTQPICHNKISEMAENHEIHFAVGDDNYFVTPGWDQALLDAYDALENKIHVFSLLDNRDPKGMPAPAITKAYIDAMGWRIPPYFMHWYCDTWTTEIAKANNCLTHLTDYMLIHDKKSERGIKDSTYLRIRNLGAVDRDAYVAQNCAHWLEVEKERLRSKLCAVG